MIRTSRAAGASITRPPPRVHEWGGSPRTSIAGKAGGPDPIPAGTAPGGRPDQGPGRLTTPTSRRLPLPPNPAPALRRACERATDRESENPSRGRTARPRRRESGPRPFRDAYRADGSNGKAFPIRTHDPRPAPSEARRFGRPDRGSQGPGRASHRCLPVNEAKSPWRDNRTTRRRARLIDRPEFGQDDTIACDGVPPPSPRIRLGDTVSHRRSHEAPENGETLGRRGQFPIEAHPGLTGGEASELDDRMSAEIHRKAPETALCGSA